MSSPIDVLREELTRQEAIKRTIARYLKQGGTPKRQVEFEGR
jgi:hypothetical protein